jgi:hypothetical protein
VTGAHLFSTTIEESSKIENSSDVTRTTEKGVVFSDAVRMQNIFFFFFRRKFVLPKNQFYFEGKTIRNNVLWPKIRQSFDIK